MPFQRQYYRSNPSRSRVAPLKSNARGGRYFSAALPAIPISTLPVGAQRFHRPGPNVFCPTSDVGNYSFVSWKKLQMMSEPSIDISDQAETSEKGWGVCLNIEEVICFDWRDWNLWGSF